MPRNDYRRALIMLRGLEEGFSGHVRLEKRIYQGALLFSVSAPELPGSLEAALAGTERGKTFAAPLGTLRRDGRGQARLSASFDPRNISGRPLEAYRLVLVTQVEEDQCRPVLSGNLEGSFPADWAAVRAAVCALFQPVESAAEAPAPQTPRVCPLPEADPEALPTEAVPEPPMEETSEPSPEAAPEPSSPEPPPDPVPSPPVAELPSEAPAPPPEEPQPPREVLIQVRAVPFSPEAEEAPPQDPPGEEASGPAPPGLPEGMTPWPEGAEALGGMLPEDSPGEELLFALHPLPSGSGFPFCGFALQRGNEGFQEVLRALPSPWAQDPPPGLEGWVWRNGWWTSQSPQ